MKASREQIVYKGGWTLKVYHIKNSYFVKKQIPTEHNAQVNLSIQFNGRCLACVLPHWLHGLSVSNDPLKETWRKEWNTLYI